ncbi:MAG: hypothetical protein V4543_17040 [Bacteroidota bacterium]
MPNQQIFIDKYTIPASSREEFKMRYKESCDLVAKLPGYISLSSFERNDEHGNLIVHAIAFWASEETVEKSKQLMMEEYARIGFNPAEMIERLKISVEKGMYKAFE